MIELNDHIDWVEVRTVFLSNAAVILSATVAAVSFTFDHLRRDIPMAYAWVERNWIDVPNAIENDSQLKPVRLSPVGFAN